MENFIKKVETMELKVSNEKINQTQRNNLKAEFINSLIEMFRDRGIELHRTKDGLILKVEGNEYDIHFELDAVVKGLDFDLVASVDDYKTLLETRNEREQALAKAKEKRLAEKSKPKSK